MSNVWLPCRVSADTVVSVDMLVLQQGQWAFGQIGFLPTLQALNYTALQRLQRQQQHDPRTPSAAAQGLQDRDLLNVQRFTAGYLCHRATTVFQQQVPSLQPNYNLKFPLSHRLAMVSCQQVADTLWAATTLM